MPRLLAGLRPHSALDTWIFTGAVIITAPLLLRGVSVASTRIPAIYTYRAVFAAIMLASVVLLWRFNSRIGWMFELLFATAAITALFVKDKEGLWRWFHGSPLIGALLLGASAVLYVIAFIFMTIGGRSAEHD